jgi:hypothetical protein
VKPDPAPDSFPDHERLPLDAKVMIILLLGVLSLGGVALIFGLLTLLINF